MFFCLCVFLCDLSLSGVEMALVSTPITIIRQKMCLLLRGTRQHTGFDASATWGHFFIASAAQAPLNSGGSLPCHTVIKCMLYFIQPSYFRNHMKIFLLNCISYYKNRRNVQILQPKVFFMAGMRSLISLKNVCLFFMYFRLISFGPGQSHWSHLSEKKLASTAVLKNLLAAVMRACRHYI